MKTNKITCFLSALFILSFLGSCTKETTETELSPEQSEEAAVASVEAESQNEVIFNGVFDNVMGVNGEVGIEGTGEFEGTGTRCFTVSVTRLNAPALFPVRVVLDFGAGCTGRDGHIRSGKIITEYSGRLLKPGSTAVTTFENFKIDSVSVEGTHKITNTGSATERQFTVEVTGGKLSLPGDHYRTRNSHRVITQTAGLATPDNPWDDAFEVTGHASGEVHRAGVTAAWESTIKEPLYKQFSCRWLSKGLVQVVRKGSTAEAKWAATLNYGNGACDRKAILTVNGKSREITLH